ncbi:putative NAD -binding protein [Rosellinia necatrix]|uniref:Putative NAD-binding protein n=1 Tax=Rosellinia necatrix TaxID=77044 RepID=A0A1S8A8V3_ROSNE|nr:putative NAD -binding protein [Rosellinia necatrix]
MGLFITNLLPGMLESCCRIRACSFKCQHRTEGVVLASITGNAIIIGGGSGIGGATAVAFAQAGAAGLMIADIDLNTAESTASDIMAILKQSDYRVEAVVMDVTDQESIESAFKKTADSFGRIDYCVTSAGDVNATGTFYVRRTALATMRAQEPKPNFPDALHRGNTRGSIVALGSALSINAAPYFIQYTTSKQAVLGLVKTAALDSVNDNIRVNCVSPCWPESNMTKQLKQDIPQLENTMASNVPMGRLGFPEEIADATLFLCSPRASLVTETSLIADGGMCVSLG